jgi:tetratricopeptide (TPR) repeat protein
MEQMTRTKVLAMVVLCACSAPAIEKSNFTFSVAYGSHPVGFRVVEQYDYTRSYQRVDAEGNLLTGERARPIQTLIWYPAQAVPGAKPMLVGRYLDLMATEDNFAPLSAQQHAVKLKVLLQANDISKNYERERVQVTKAVEDADPQPGPFPVVIYAPSLSGSAFENSDLCEYLASYGFIVLSSPSLGMHSRGMTWDLAGIEAQVGDIEFLIGYLRTIPQADPTRIAVAGWSWGGMTNIFAAFEDSRIQALVSLDGGFRYQPARMKEGETVGLIDANKLTVPLLYISSQAYTLEELNQLNNQLQIDNAYNFLNELKYNDTYLVETSEMIHPGFSSLFIRFREDQYFTDYSPGEFSENYSWVARYVLQFLKAYLNNDAAARQFLHNEPSKNSVPPHLFKMDVREALHPAANIPDFARELATESFDKAIEIYQRTRKNDPGFKLPEGEVNHWGYALMESGKATKAVAIFQLNVAMYPESSNAYDSLAEAQEAAGDKQAAIVNYHKSLSLSDQNQHAVARLKELEAGGKQ